MTTMSSDESQWRKKHKIGAQNLERVKLREHSHVGLLVYCGRVNMKAAKKSI